MPGLVKKCAGAILRGTGLQYWPVRVRSGFAAGARWTLYPWSAYWRGTHEPVMQETLAGLGDMTGWNCWDLGAHYGLYSIGFARRTGPTGEVAAFEPNPLSFARLERHRRMNDLGWLKLFNAAVSDRAGEAEFYTYGNLESTTTHLPYENETPGPDTKPIRVPLLRLDDLVAAGTLRAPNLVKIDVEGHAHRALAGAREALAQSRPIVVVAIHSSDEFAGCEAALSPLGYARRRIETHSGSPDEVVGHDFLFSPKK